MMTLFSPLFLCSLLAGWLVGGLANWAADTWPPAGTRVRLRTVRAWPHYWTLGWYLLRNDCPHCGAARPWRAPVLEATMAVTFGVAASLFPTDPLSLLVTWFYAAFLLTILVIDLEHRLVLNAMLAPAAVVIGLTSLLPTMPGLGSALVGGLLGFAIFLLIYIVGRGRLGAGDVKLAGVIGLMTGYPAVWSALLSGVMLGGIAAVVLLLIRRAGRKSTMAYAPYMAIGALMTLWATLGAL